MVLLSHHHCLPEEAGVKAWSWVIKPRSADVGCGHLTCWLRGPLPSNLLNKYPLASGELKGSCFEDM